MFHGLFKKPRFFVLVKTHLHTPLYSITRERQSYFLNRNHLYSLYTVKLGDDACMCWCNLLVWPSILSLFFAPCLTQFSIVLTKYKTGIFLWWQWLTFLHDYKSFSPLSRRLIVSGLVIKQKIMIEMMR